MPNRLHGVPSSSTPVPTFVSRPCASVSLHVDAVLYTHAHADHILGMDDLRPLSFVSHRAGGLIPLYASEETAAVLRRVYDYTFADDASYINRARVEIRPLAHCIRVHEVEFLRVPVMHGGYGGFRFPLRRRRVSDRRQRHSRIQLRPPGEPGNAGASLAAPQAASQPRHAGAGRRMGPANRRAPHLAYPHCP